MRINQTFTIAAGTPINLKSGGPSSDGIPCYATQVRIRPLLATSGGVVYVYDGIGNKRVPTSADLTDELAAATATIPGGLYEDWDKSLDRGGINVTEIWIDGAHTGDPVAASYVPKV